MNQKPTENGLSRDIGLSSALVLVIANMVGTGVFTTTGFIIGELGGGLSLLACWLVGGLFALAGALCYGELGARLPRAGGEYIYLHRAFGPLPAFLSGWISLIVGFSAPIAAAAIAFSAYLVGSDSTPWFAFELGGLQIFRISPASLPACAAVVLLSLVHCHSLGFGKRVQNILTLFKLLLIIGFILLGFWLGQGDMAHITQTIPDALPGVGGFAVALVFVSFAYSGWNAAAYLGSEIRNPGRNLPLALTLGTMIVIALYLLLNMAFLYAVPPERMQGILEVGELAATVLFGQSAGTLFGVAVAIGLLSVMSAMIMAGPRVYFAMARDGLFFPGLARIHVNRKTPSRAILFQGAMALVMIMVSAFDQLLIYIGFTLSLSATLTVAGLFRLRRRYDSPDTFRCPGYPLVPLFFIAGNLWIIIYTVISRPLTVLFGVSTILVGAGLYSIFRRRCNTTLSNRCVRVETKGRSFMTSN